MDHLGLVAGLQVPEDGGVVEESQVDHVLALLELGRVDPAHLRLLVGELLVTDSLGSLVNRSCFQSLLLQRNILVLVDQGK